MTVMVQLPVAWTLKLSTPEAPVTSVLPDPDGAMTLGSDSASATESVSLMMKLSPPGAPSVSLPEKVHATMQSPLAGALNAGVTWLPVPDQAPILVPAAGGGADTV